MSTRSQHLHLTGPELQAPLHEIAQRRSAVITATRPVRTATPALSGIVLEGVSAAGKTTILRRVQEHLSERLPGCTKLMLSEHYTERVFEDDRANGTLSIADVLDHTQNLVSMVRQLHDLKSGSKFEQAGPNASVFVFIERWTGSHAAHVEMSGAQFRCSAPSAIERSARQIQDLTDMGVGLVVLHLPPALLLERITSTLGHRNPEWRRFVRALGGPPGARDHFARWQEALFAHYELLGVPFLTLDASDPRRAACTLIDRTDPGQRVA